MTPAPEPPSPAPRRLYRPNRGLAVPRKAAAYPPPPAPPGGPLAEALQHATLEPVCAFAWDGRPGWRVPERRIADDLWFCARSACRFRIGPDRAWRTLPPGRLLLVPQGVAHAIEPARPDASVLHYSAHFFLRTVGGAGLLELREAGGDHDPGGTDAIAASRAMAREFAWQSAGWRQALSAALWPVLLEVLRRQPESRRRQAPGLVRRLARLQPVFRLVEERLEDPALTVGEMARAIHVSEPYLRRLMRKATGTGPVAWLHRRRLERACGLLTGSEAGLKQVAERAGFASLTLFHRLFSRQFRTTPAAYRVREV
jgi:AraC-like DNA-binding protein